MRIVTILGARPQFIKAAAVCRAIRRHNARSATPIAEILVHTGQHYDENMSGAFFDELGLARPDFNLGISGLSHGAMTGRMLEAIESVLVETKPEAVLVYGDTNSTLAGALAASKLHIPVAHVEAGLRSFNMRMPEEINRILTDRVASELFCPTQEAVKNLLTENIHQGVHCVGDVMHDVALHYQTIAREKISLNQWGVSERAYALSTIHRAENTDNTVRLQSICSALREIAGRMPLLLPLHPRTRQLLDTPERRHWLEGITILNPLPYLQMTRLEMSAKVILTDSGGIQKEAYFHKVPCITLRDETEWVETVELGWNAVAGTETANILDAFANLDTGRPVATDSPYGEGDAAEKIVAILVDRFA